MNNYKTDKNTLCMPAAVTKGSLTQYVMENAEKVLNHQGRE